ncbi:MAG: hypothetical protein RLZZ597_543 [Cyanobacteriota bacterium]|jgi:hypothetical protein
MANHSTFWPFGGLFNHPNQSKAAYYRLQTLKTAWGL